jgi:hypothetical protein
MVFFAIESTFDFLAGFTALGSFWFVLHCSRNNEREMNH